MLGDLWEFDLAAVKARDNDHDIMTNRSRRRGWFKLSDHQSSLARSYHCLTFMPACQSLIVYGGQQTASDPEAQNALSLYQNVLSFNIGLWFALSSFYCSLSFLALFLLVDSLLFSICHLLI